MHIFMGLVDMVFQGFPSTALFVAMLTSVGEGIREVLGLNMVPHMIPGRGGMGRGMGMVPHMIPGIVVKLIAQSAAKAFTIIFGNILHQIIRRCHWTW